MYLRLLIEISIWIYNLMDLGYLQTILEKIDLKTDIIDSIAKYCVQNSKGTENDIAKIIQKQFQTHIIEKKIAIFVLVSEIFLMTGVGENKDTKLIKLISPNIKHFIDEIARRVTEIKPEYIRYVPSILRKWEEPNKEIYNPNFMDKLKKSAEPIISMAMKQEEQLRNGTFKNYSKTFLMEYEDIKSDKLTDKIYDHFVQFDKIANEIGHINEEMKRLGLERKNKEISERALELRDTLMKFVDKLQEIICVYHGDFKILREACLQEFEKLPPEAKKVLEKNT